MWQERLSEFVTLFIVVNPISALPMFLALTAGFDTAQQRRVAVTAVLTSFGVLVLFIIAGGFLLEKMGISLRSFQIAGGIILFLIALRMIFRSREGIFGDTPAGEPLIVPLAIPSIAGPAAIATVVLLVSRAPQRLVEWLLAATVAIAVSFVVLIFAERISRWLGERVLDAFEKLMGLLLTAIAVEMLLRGIEGFVRYMQGN
jgi:MarC family membrane protein